ncbi:MAG TPA: penicillin-binding transpeptidase domain-containing protein [Planococcus sp. (in: firmicutes)]|nr:penicillin-binding transpeptidase domain-containing protein [Planococcus sp. (in: firmicutes)]
MTKLLQGSLSLLALVLLTGCQPDQPTPEDRLNDYINHWNAEEFSDMYTNFLNEGTKNTFDTEAFVDRQDKLFDDLSIENLEVSFTDLPEDMEWNTDEPADFPVQVKMDTVAGPVEFEETMTLLYETQEEAENWFVEWNPAFILPGLEAEDTVRLSRNSAARGEILDREGRPVAINGTGFEIGIVPERLEDGSAMKAEIAELLGVTEEYIDTQLGQSWVKEDLFVPITKTIKTNTELIAEVEEMAGVTYRETAMREYPYGESLSHLTGYIGRITAEQLAELEDEGYTESDSIGRQGLEQRLEDRLRGKDGMRIFIDKAGENGEQITVAETETENGEVVSLTIDAELQQETYDAMSGEAGTSAAIDPNTGETLALVSSPAFDPNEFVVGMSSERYEELSEDPLNPFYNRFDKSYAPGSTIKPVTAAIGMEAGTLDPSQGLTIEGATWQKDSSWGDYRVTRLHPEAPNPIDLNKALVYSDNIYFARQALDMGREDLVSGFESYGFGEDIPFFWNLRSSQISNDGTIESEGQTADTSFGQGQMLTNILHLAAIYQPFITDGIMYEPTLLLEEEKGQIWKEGLVSPTNADILRSGMRNVVVDGYAQSANIPSFALAGKTGTAELKTEIGEDGQENGFFVAYDSENPQFIMSMMIEGIEDQGGSDYVADFVANAFVGYYGNITEE